MIYILGGHHCDIKLYKRVIEILKKIKPDLFCVEELTHDEKVIDACKGLVDGTLSLDTFKDSVEFEKYWFHFSDYQELFAYLQKSKTMFYPIDHSLKERISLIKLERKILDAIKSGKDSTVLKEQGRQFSVFDREKDMVINIDKGIKKCKAKNVCVIVGNSHTDRVGDALTNMGYQVVKKSITNKKDMAKYFDRVFRYSVKNNLSSLNIPPLVPIFVEVFKESNKI